ncbi:MAG: prolyl oligopeptidase family serine peptidase [Actinobacteria bacterium]|nr:prolyl oligopeptidase family serine peptidase [Actinomycetota bacterium]
MSFNDNLFTLDFISGFDNSTRKLLLSLPLNPDSKKSYPLIVSPHPFGWSNFENFFSGAADLLYPFKGWTGISEKYGAVVALPLGHGRFYEKISLSYEAQIEDLVMIPDVLMKSHVRIDTDRMFLCGLSMGGMETMTVLGAKPGIFKAGFSFNGIADLAAWYGDVGSGKADRKLTDMDILKLVEDETGGTPGNALNIYLKRSAVNYIGALSGSNLMIYWSSMDSIVVGQEEKQGKKLYDIIKGRNPGAAIFEHDHTHDHGFEKFDREERIKCHEFSDFDLAAHWFLKNY